MSNNFCLLSNNFCLLSNHVCLLSNDFCLLSNNTGVNVLSNDTGDTDVFCQMTLMSNDVGFFVK